MTDLRLSPQEQAVFDLFLKKPERTLVALRAIYAAPATPLPARPDHALTAILRSLNRKLSGAKRGSITRISHRGRGHVGRYKYKWR